MGAIQEEGDERLRASRSDSARKQTYLYDTSRLSVAGGTGFDLRTSTAEAWKRPVVPPLRSRPLRDNSDKADRSNRFVFHGTRGKVAQLNWL
jgi:hypothetical protein